jgi:hypothetical protein
MTRFDNTSHFYYGLEEKEKYYTHRLIRRKKKVSFPAYSCDIFFYFLQGITCRKKC